MSVAAAKGVKREQRRLIDEHPTWCFQNRIVAYQSPGRSSFDEPGANGSSLGSGILVLDNTSCPVRTAWRLVRFFHHESCGQCTPCREGTGWLDKVMHRIESGGGRVEDLDLLLDVGDNISPGPFPHPQRLGAEPSTVPFPYRQTTICPLGPSAVSPIESSVWRFRDDYLLHIKEGGCPYRVRPASAV